MSVLLCLVLCLSLSLGAFADGQIITVDGKEVNQVNEAGEKVPEVEGYVPLRAVIKAMGYSIDYDAETSTVKAGTFADPELVFVPGENDTVLMEGTTYIKPGKLTKLNNDFLYNYEKKGDELSYTNIYSEVEEGYYRISLGGKYLTAKELPPESIFEVKTGEDGTEESVEKTPRQQVMATNLYLAEKSDESNQLWLVKELSGKRYALINKNTELAMDVNNWSREKGAKLIQYTLAGGTNQQFVFVKTADGYAISSIHSRLFIKDVGADELGTGLKSEEILQDTGYTTWQLELDEKYTNPVDLVLESEAYKELDPYYQERFKTYFFTDIDFSTSANSKAEAFLRQKGFASADKDTQKALIFECLSLTYSDLLGGSMQQKLTANYKIASVEKKLKRPTKDWVDGTVVGENEEQPKEYYVYTIEMECTSPEDIHTFTVETIDENDEEHVLKVAEAVACFEPPVRKTLKHFYYTGEKYGTWNAWAGEIWNNTGGKMNVDGMLSMFAHELGHVIDADFTVGDDVWRRAINADVIPVSTYGQSNRWEDFGEFSRLYLLARGNDERMAAIEKMYPHRTATYRAALYNIGKDYYTDYKELCDTLTAPIGNTENIDGEQYCTVVTDGKALTNTEDGLILAENTGADNQLWQISASDRQLLKLYSKAAGKAVTAYTGINSEIIAGSGSAIGAMPVDSGYVLTVSETGFALKADGEKVIAALEGSSVWEITPVEKVEGMGIFTIKSGDKYLAPSSADRGARLTLSDSDDMSVWYVNKLPNNVGYITNTANDFAIDISGASEAEGAAALTYTLSRNANQMWLIEANDNGTVSFKAQHSGLYLAVDAEGLAMQSAEKYEWTMEEVK